MARKKDLEAQAFAQYDTLKRAVQASQTIQSTLLKSSENSQKINLKNIGEKWNYANKTAHKEYDLIRNLSLSLLNKYVKTLPIQARDWEDPLWKQYSLPTKTESGRYIRLGEMRADRVITRLPVMPALIPFVSQKHILLSFKSSQSKFGSGLLESLAWRLTVTLKTNSFQLILLDPMDRGSNLASLLNLPESIRGPKIFCQKDEIDEVIQQLASDVEDVIQQRLLNTYKDIEEYNNSNPDVAVPYRFLIFVGFPKGFSDQSADLLFSIARSGQRSGVYILGGVLRGEKSPHNFKFDQFMELANFISVNSANEVRFIAPEFENTRIKPDSPPPAQLINKITHLIKTDLINSQSTTIPFKKMAVRKANWWKADSNEGLEAVLGIDQSGNPYKLSIGTNNHHILLGGATGSGKTNLLHLMILMLATTYHPENLGIYLIDFKEGVEFQDYVTYSLPHAKAVVIEAEREFGLSILHHLVEEMEKRSQLFKVANATNISQYRTNSGQRLPRLLLIMDEYVVLFSEDDRIANQSSEALSSLVMRGRSFGIHVILSAQRPASTFLSMSQIKSQMGIRIATKCHHQDDSTMILGEGNEKATRISSPGEACITDDPTRPDKTAQVRIVYADPDNRVLYLRGLKEFAKLKKYSPKYQTIIFSRDAPAIWQKSPSIEKYLSTHHFQPLNRPVFWLGQPLRIADEISVSLEEKNGSNLLLDGNDESLAGRIILHSLLGLGLSFPPQNLSAILIGEFDPSKSYDQAILSLKTTLPFSIQYNSRQKAIESLEQISQNLEHRLDQYPTHDKNKVILVIYGIQHWTDVRGQNNYTPSQAAEQLSYLWQQGPRVGIHTLIWVDQLESLANICGGGWQRNLKAFNYRVAFQMTTDESISLLSVTDASRLGSERANYRDESWPSGVVDKFKPYSLPSIAEIESLGQIIRQTWKNPK